MEDLTELPTRRLSVKGVDYDGNTIVLALVVAKKLYRCPGCGGDIDVGSDHVLVRVAKPAGESYHQHWHRDCARSLLREMKGSHSRPAGELSLPRAPRRRRKGKK